MLIDLLKRVFRILLGTVRATVVQENEVLAFVIEVTSPHNDDQQFYINILLGFKEDHAAVITLVDALQSSLSLFDHERVSFLLVDVCKIKRVDDAQGDLLTEGLA